LKEAAAPSAGCGKGEELWLGVAGGAAARAAAYCCSGWLPLLSPEDVPSTGAASARARGGGILLETSARVRQRRKGGGLPSRRWTAEQALKNGGILKAAKRRARASALLPAYAFSR